MPPGKTVIKRLGVAVLVLTSAYVLAACKPDDSEPVLELASKQAPDSAPGDNVGSQEAYFFPFEFEQSDDAFKITVSQAMQEAGLGSLWENHGVLKSGPQSPLKPVKVAGVIWLRSSACQAHNCAAHNLIYLYQPDTRAFVGIHHNESTKQLIGNPDPEQLKALQNG